jgi:GTPase
LKKRGVHPMAISAATQQHVRELVGKVFELTATLPEMVSPHPVEETPIYDLPESDMTFEIARQADGSFRVSGARIERAAAMTYWDYEEAVLRFQKILETLGISKALEQAGIQVGDTVYIGSHELEWSD